MGSGLKQKEDYVPEMRRSISHTQATVMRGASGTEYFGVDINSGSYSIVLVNLPSRVWRDSTKFECLGQTCWKSLITTVQNQDLTEEAAENNE